MQTSNGVRKISVNGRFLFRPATGVDRFAFEIMRSIDTLIAERDPSVAGLDLELLVPDGPYAIANPFGRIPMRTVQGRRGQAWEQWALPGAARGSLLLNLCNSAPLFMRNQITVIHDAAPVRVPDSYSRAFRSWYRVMAPCVGRAARRIVTVSRFSRGELIDAYRIPGRKIGVISESGEHMLRHEEDETILSRHGIGARPFVLAVSSLNRHKNFRLVIDALRHVGDAEFDVVVAGGTDPAVYGSGAEPLPDYIKHVGFVSDGELKTLFRHALCFVHPSRYEGFGLPPVEAMTLGCPIVVADLPAVREACGEAAIYVSPDDPAALAAALLRVSGDSAERDAMRARGLARAAELTWRASAVQLLAEIRPCVA